MNQKSDKAKKRKVAWGITGAGDKIAEFIEEMKKIQQEYADTVEIQVFLSKAGDQVLKYYRLEENLKNNFSKVKVEINANAPFLAAMMQMGKYDFLIIAPSTSNSVSKIANGIGDTLLTNAAIMSLKAFVPVYIAPTDYEEGTVYTKLPNGKEMKLRVRKEEVDQVRKLENKGAEVIVCGSRKVDIKKTFKVLGKRGINKVLVEGGGTLNCSVLEEGLVSSLLINVSPKIIGGKESITLVEGKVLKKFLNLKLKRIIKQGNEIVLEYNIIR